MPGEDITRMKQLYTVKVTEGILYECLGDLELGLQEGDMAVVQCDRYLDYVKVVGLVGEPIADVEEFERQRALASKGRHVEGKQTPVILRKGTDEDAQHEADNSVLADEAFHQAKSRISAHGLEMKLIHSHYALDRKLLLFQFSADGRVDFRELLRDLSTLFHCRVELRQIGVRDESGLMGGLGICGRPFCCKTFLTTFNSINVRMAKQQGISLNPQNISGTCGRLKCCLYYEAEAYKDVVIAGKKQLHHAAEEVDENELAKLDAKEHAASDERGQKPAARQMRQGGQKNQRGNGDGQRRGPDASQMKQVKPQTQGSKPQKGQRPPKPSRQNNQPPAGDGAQQDRGAQNS